MAQNTKIGKYVKKTSPGPKKDPGVTRDRILWEIYYNIDGISEPEIREILKNEFGITDSKGIKKNHLGKLEEEGLIYKISSPGGSNVWCPCKMDYANFQAFWESLDEEKRCAFFFTDYVQDYSQKIIEVEFLPYMKFCCNMENTGFDGGSLENWKIESDLLNFVQMSFKLSPTLFSHCLDKDMGVTSLWSMIRVMELHNGKEKLDSIKSQITHEQYICEFKKLGLATYGNVEKNILICCMSALCMDSLSFSSQAMKNDSRSSFCDAISCDIANLCNSDNTRILFDKYSGKSRWLDVMLDFRRIMKSARMH